MPWLFTTLLAYLSFGIVSFGDRFLLVRSLPSPKLYAFFIGIVQLLIIPFLIPFGITFPRDWATFFVGMTAGVCSMSALIPYFQAIRRSEVSRVVPAVGAFVPIFTLLGTFFLGSGEVLSLREIYVFFILIFGGILISAKRLSLRYFFWHRTFALVVLASLLFSFWVLGMKIVFERIGFGGGLTLGLIGRAFTAGIFALVFPEVREGVFREKLALQKRVMLPLLGFQFFGAAGSFLQTFSISIAKISEVPLVNALEGTRYVFLFLLVWVASRWNPELLKEEMGGKVFWQKIAATLLIVLGIVLLVMK